MPRVAPPLRMNADERVANAKNAAAASAASRRVKALEDHIRRVVDSAPPLSESQRARLATLIASGGK